MNDRRWIEWIAYTIVAASFVFYSIIVFQIPARAHSWYPAACCSGRDCAPIRASAITRLGHNYVVTLRRGEHPMLDPATEITIRQWPIDQTEASQDTEAHICLSPIDARVLCLFMPLNG
jgi:hypothetical protein